MTRLGHLGTSARGLGLGSNASVIPLTRIGIENPIRNGFSVTVFAESWFHSACNNLHYLGDNQVGRLDADGHVVAALCGRRTRNPKRGREIPASGCLGEAEPEWARGAPDGRAQELDPATASTYRESEGV